MWQHQDTLGALGQEPQWPLWPCHSAVPGHRVGTEGLELSNAVMEAAAPPVPLVTLCSGCLEMLLLSTQK